MLRSIVFIAIFLTLGCQTGSNTSYKSPGDLDPSSSGGNWGSNRCNSNSDPGCSLPNEHRLILPQTTPDKCCPHWLKNGH